MNDAFETLFPQYEKLQGIDELKNKIRATFAHQHPVVVKDREDGYDIHSFLLENSDIKLFETKDIKKVLKLKQYSTIVLELHQDEVEKHLHDICTAIISGKHIMNDPRTIFIVHDKRLLSVLCDPVIMKRYMTTDEAELLKRSIIPTYTHRAHKKIFARAGNDKVKWVAKKAISGKADGLYIGKEKEKTEWKAILKRPDTLLQPYVEQRKFVFWDPYKRKNNSWYIAGVLPMWNDHVFGPGLYRISHIHKHDFAGFIQPMTATIDTSDET